MEVNVNKYMLYIYSLHAHQTLKMEIFFAFKHLYLNEGVKYVGFILKLIAMENLTSISCSQKLKSILLYGVKGVFPFWRQTSFDQVYFGSNSSVLAYFGSHTKRYFGKNKKVLF